MKTAIDCLNTRKPEIYEGKRGLEVTAFHEAGHAIVRRLASLAFSTIAIHVNTAGDIVGFVGDGDDAIGTLKKIRADHKKPIVPIELPTAGTGGPIHKSLAFRYACMYVAGMQAELILHGIATDPPLIRDDVDHTQATALLSEAFGTTDLRYAQAQTRHYLARCWDEVKRTAAELLARHEHDDIGIIKRDNPQDAGFFSPDVDGAVWVDETWY